MCVLWVRSGEQDVGLIWIRGCGPGGVRVSVRVIERRVCVCTSWRGVWDVNRKIVASNEALRDSMRHVCLWVEGIDGFADWNVVLLKRAGVTGISTHHGSVGSWHWRAHGNICGHW